MKTPFIYLAALFLTAGLAVAQTTGDKAAGTATHTGKEQPPDPAAKTSGKKGHKGGKKGHKGSKVQNDARPGVPPPTRPPDPKE